MAKSFVQELGERLASVESRLSSLSSGNRLDHASLDGTTLYLRDYDGNLSGRLGRQPDGSNGVHVVRVQPPPQLTAAILTVGEQAGTCLVEWDGGTFDGRRMPLIHGHTEIWAELVGEDWSPTVAPGEPAKRVGTIRDRTGGEVVVALPQAGIWAVWLRAMGADRETAGPWSPVATVEIVPLVDTEAIEADLEDARDRITEADERLTSGQAMLTGNLETLNTEVIPGLEQDLTDAQQQADTRYSELNTRANTAEQNISEATDRLTAAETTLAPLPGDVAEAQSSATAAREAAEAAEARAVEASNNAGNRIDNGGFELGLDHWITSSVTITTDAHSGDQAALIADGGTLSPMSSIPVSGGDVWDISLFGKAATGTLDMAVQELDEAGNIVGVVDSFTVQSTSDWANSGRQRVTMPEGSGRVSFEVTAVGGDWAVDDIVLRDVTDVVRLEQAAKDAADKAEAAESKADALQLAVEGEGGLRDRLDTTETTLQGKAESSALSDLSTLVSGRERVRTGEGVPDETTAARGVTYEWAGTPHASESIKRVDGVEVARNLIVNGDFENGSTGWGFAGGVARFYTDLSDELWGGLGGTYLNFDSYAGSTRITADTETLINNSENDGWLAVSGYLAVTGGDTARIQVAVNDGAGWSYPSTGWQSADYPDGRLFTLTIPVSGITEALVYLQSTRDQPASGRVLWADKIRAATADTEADALDQVETYFDGDSPDALAGPAPEGTIYYQVDDETSSDPAILAIWRRGADGWTELPLRDEVLRSVSVGKLVADSASINKTVTEQLLANTAIVERLEAEQGYVGGVNLKDGTVMAEVVEASQQVITDVLAANVGLVRDELIVQGDLLADTASILAGEMKQLTVTERADFVSAWADELYADEFTARSSTVARQIVAASPLFPRLNEAGLMGSLELDQQAALVDQSRSSTGKAIQFTPDADGRAYGPYFAISPGEIIDIKIISGRIGGDQAEGGIWYVGVYRYDEENGSATGLGPYIEMDRTGSHNWGTVNHGSITIPDDATEKFARIVIRFDAGSSPRSDGHTTVYDIEARRALGGRLIVQGLLQASTAELEDLFFDTAVGNALWVNAVQSRLIESQGIITEDMIATGAITTPKLTVTEELVGEIAKLIRIEAGSLASNDIEAMRIVSSLIEATTYLIHDADGEVSVRLDGVANYIAGRIRAGMTEGSSITLDYGQKIRFSGLNEEGEADPQRTIDTPYMNFRTGDVDYQEHQEPSIHLERGSDNADGMMIINPGYPVGTDPFRGKLNVVGDVVANRLEARDSMSALTGYHLPRSSNQPGGLTMDSSLRTRLLGRMADDHGPHDMVIHGTAAESIMAPGSANRGQVVFDAPSPTGVRHTHAWGHVAYAAFGYDNNRAVTVSTSARSASSFRFTRQPARNNSGDVQCWVYYAAYWV